ncbi:hypothetical protein A3Q56_07210, partial [Intoshia linei]
LKLAYEFEAKKDIDFCQTNQLNEILKKLDVNVNLDKVETYKKNLDSSDSGVIDFTSFISMMTIFALDNINGDGIKTAIKTLNCGTDEISLPVSKLIEKMSLYYKEDEIATMKQLLSDCDLSNSNQISIRELKKKLTKFH